MSQSMICSLVLALRSIWRASMFTALPPSVGEANHFGKIMTALAGFRQRVISRGRERQSWLYVGILLIVPIARNMGMRLHCRQNLQTVALHAVVLRELFHCQTK